MVNRWTIHKNYFFILNFKIYRYKGIICGWASPTIYLLTSNESPLPTGKISMNEASWIASLLVEFNFLIFSRHKARVKIIFHSYVCFQAIGGFVGNMFFGYLANRFGRKGPLLFISIPMIVSGLRFKCYIFGLNCLIFISTVELASRSLRSEY